MTERVWVVYRLYTKDGRLLYVGKGHGRADDRLAAHQTRPWGHLIHSRTLANYPTEQAALEAEAEAIRLESPRYNRHHNRGRYSDDRAFPVVGGLDPFTPPEWVGRAAAGIAAFCAFGFGALIWVTSR